ALISPELSNIVTDKTKVKQIVNELNNLKGEKFNITYTEWQRKKSENSSGPISTKTVLIDTMETFIPKFIDEINNLADHIDRVRSQFRAAKQARNDAVTSDDIITLQLDWSEHYSLRQSREERSN
ncbi:unnamed protein product, partial [Didymodactylos carnosus]